MDGYNLRLIVERISPDAKLPVFNDDQDAGMDVFAYIPEGELRIAPGKTVCISTGLKLGIEEGWFLDVRPRSGISLNTPLRVANAPGTIDTNFKGEVKIIMTNTSGLIRLGAADTSLYDDLPMVLTEGCVFDITDKGNYAGTYIIKNGDKIAQLVPMKRYRPEIFEGNASSVGTDRGGGFNSSGIR